MVSGGHLGILRGLTRGTLAASGQGSCKGIYVHQRKRALQCLVGPPITPCEINPPLTGSAIALFAAGLWNKGKVQSDGVAPEVFDASCSSPEATSGPIRLVETGSRYLDTGGHCAQESV